MRVAIVGAGISGLYLAWKLAEKGQEIIVFEKEKEIPKKACSGLVSERILNFVPESKNLIKNKIDFVLVHFPKKTLKINFKKNFFVLDSFELKKTLFNLAQKSGAKIFFGQPISALPIGFNRVIGCDGANSKIRKILKLKDPDFYLAIQGFSKEKQNLNFAETWPTKYGFLWKIPRGKEIEYGIIEKTKRARKIFEEFLKKRGLERVNSAIVPQGFSIPKQKRITLCGDAAGLTKPWSGGGIIWGLMAAQILLKNFPDFLKYQKEMKRFFSLNIPISKLAKKVVYFWGFNFPFLLPKKFKIDGDFLI